MGPLFALILTIIGFGSATISHNQFFSIGKEVVFQYESNVTVRTDQPASYASSFGLQAKVYVQKTHQDKIMVRLNNIVFNLENGPIRGTVSNANYVPIPTEAEALKLPFTIKYDSNTLVTDLIVDINDKEWSYNIKKSIASIFQLNNEVMTTVDGPIFVKYSIEPTVYGVCNVTYGVLPGEDLTVVKTSDLKQCENNYNLKRNAKMWNFYLYRVYKINQKENKGRIEMIEARGDIAFAQLKEITSLKVYQRFMFIEEFAITNPPEISNQLVLHSLKYENLLSKCRDPSVNTLFDITGGRVKYNYNVLIAKVQVWLDQFVNYLNENHLTLATSDSKGLKLLQNLLDALENFDLKTLKHTFVLLQEQTEDPIKELDTINLFVQLLPHVGTRSSALFIRNLISKQKIDESMAVRVLRDLSAHVRCPNEKLLNKLESLLELGKTDSRVYRASVLAFASLIKRVYLGVDEKSIILDKYIKLFMQKIRSSQDYNIQVLYVHALGNIGIESVVDTLAPILTGEMVVERNLRSLALWSVAPLLQKNPSLMIKYVWPILSDRKLDISLRTAAYDIYVHTENPTLNQFRQLYWLMRDEENERFYNFHYNTLLTFFQLKSAPNNENKIFEIVRTILQMSHRPIVPYQYDGIFINDFIDKKSGLSEKLENLYSIEKHTNIRSRVMSHIDGFETEIYSLHLGMGIEPTYIEYIIRQEGRTVMTHVEDNVNLGTFNDIAKDLGFVDAEMNKYNKIFEIPFLYERIMPSDIGTPIRISEMLPNIHTIFAKIDIEQMKFDFKIKSMNLHNTGFKVYNPINDLWHGIDENKQINFQFGFSVSFEKLLDHHSTFKIKMKLSSDTISGFQVHHENIVYIKGENAQELLSQFNKDSLVRRSILRGENYIHNTVLYNTKSNTLGQQIEVKVFDCDRNISRDTIIPQLQKFDNYDIHDNFIPLELLHSHLPTLFQSGDEGCGYGVRFTPIKTLNHLEFNISLGIPTDLKGMTQWEYLFSLSLQVDVQGATRSVDNTNLATYSSRFAAILSAIQRKFDFKWWIVHNDQVNKERKLDFDLHYEIKDDHVDSKLIVSLGEVDKLGVISFDIKGTRSEEQQQILNGRKLTYNECRPGIERGQYVIPLAFECAVAHSNLNRYAINITANDAENRMVQMVLNYLNALRHDYSTYAQTKTKTKTNVLPMHLDVVNPVFQNEWDITVDTPSYTEIYTGIPKPLIWSRHLWETTTSMSLPNIFFTPSIPPETRIDRVSSMAQCVIAKEYVATLNGIIKRRKLKNDWALYLKASTHRGNEFYNLYVKNGNGNRPLAIRVTTEIGSLELVPKNHEFDTNIKIDNNLITPIVGKYTEESEWKYLMVESPKIFMFGIKMHGLFVIYDGITIRTFIPATQSIEYGGYCMNQVNPGSLLIDRLFKDYPFILTLVGSYFGV